MESNFECALGACCGSSVKKQKKRWHKKIEQNFWTPQTLKRIIVIDYYMPIETPCYWFFIFKNLSIYRMHGNGLKSNLIKIGNKFRCKFNTQLLKANELTLNQY